MCGPSLLRYWGSVADVLHASLLLTILWLLYGVIAFMAGWVVLMRLQSRGILTTPEPSCTAHNAPDPADPAGRTSEASASQ